MIPAAKDKELHITLVLTEENTNGIRVYFHVVKPDYEPQLKQSSFHPTDNLSEALESAWENWTNTDAL